MSTNPPPKPTSADPISAVLVGHCGPDSWMLKSVVGRALPGASVSFVSDHAATVHAAATADLLLVNRVLDGSFDDDSGIALIAALRDHPGRRAALMLISNLPDAQAQAEAAGAAPGFGKSNAGSPVAADRLRQAAQHARSRVSSPSPLT